MLSYLRLNRCDDFATDHFNPARVLSYLQCGEVCGVGSGWGNIVNYVDPNCFCPALLPDPPPVIVSPSVDPAPWYDPARPESGRFLGVLITKMTGFDGTLSRTPQNASGFGNRGSLGPLQTKLREIGVEALIFACDQCSMEYGMRWLISTLTGPCQDGCGSCDVEVRLCCPGEDDAEDTGSWLLQNSGITDGPHWGDFPLKDAECLVRTVNWTIGSDSPYLYKCAEVCMEDEPMWLGDYDGSGTGGQCPDEIKDWFNGCARVCCSLVNPYTIGTNSASITLTTGERAAYDVTVSGYIDRFGDDCPRPLSVPTCDGGPQCVEEDACLSFLITEIPPYTTFVWDSARKEVYFVVNGGTTTPAYNRIVLPDDEPFTWLETSCRQVCLCVSVARRCNIAPGAPEADPYLTVTITSTHKEL